MPYLPSQPVLPLITSCLYPRTPHPDHAVTTANGESLEASTAAMNGNGVVEDQHHSSDGMDIDGVEGLASIRSPYTHESAPLVRMFKEEFCRRHGWPKEEPLEVVVDLGSRGGALSAVEKARRVMGNRLGNIRTWTDLPVSHFG
jgi:hypothetical protein